jgi:steroid delta-isomerase-like uncharacterized protein
MRKFGKIVIYLLLVIAFTVLLGFMAEGESSAVGDLAANKEILRRALDEFWNQRDVGAINELYSTDYLGHDPNGLHGATLEEFKQSAAGLFIAFPDFHLTIDDEVAEGDKVVKRWTVTGTHRGELMGIPPTEKNITITGVNFYRIADGKIVETWWSSDALGMLTQLGVIPPMGREDFTWGAPSAVTGDPGDLVANKDIVHRYIEEVWNQKNLDVLDELMSTDVINHSPARYELGLEAHKQVMSTYLTGFPDIHTTADDIIAEGDKVVNRWTATGTHQGELMGVPATGKKVVWTGITVVRFADGKIVEMWWSYDVLGILQQIGVIPPLG